MSFFEGKYLAGITVKHIKRDGTLEPHPDDHVPRISSVGNIVGRRLG